jgi:hypothetical protein
MTDDKLMIGREGAAVPDPLNHYRPLLGSWAQEIDDRATLHGLTLVGLDDAALEAHKAELDTPLASDLDPGAATIDLRWSDRYDRRQREQLSINEEYSVAYGRAEGRLSWEELGEALGDLADEAARASAKAEIALENWEEMPEKDYVRSWTWQYADDAAQSIAVDRELAIRSALRAPERGHEPRIPEGFQFKEIGTGDGSELAAKLAVERAKSHPPLTARHVQRDMVEHPPLLEGVRGTIGERRTSELETRMADLERLLAHAPDAWIRERHAELGATPRFPDGKAAAGFLRLEQLSEVAAAERDQALANVERFTAGAEQARADAEQRIADWVQGKLDSYQQGLAELRGKGVDLDGWVADNEDALIRAGAYEREHEIRRRLDVARLVERSVAEPGKHLERLGPQPAWQMPERREWDRLARAIETPRLDRESAERAGLPAAEVDPVAERELAGQVDQFRVEQGMEPIAQDAQRLALESGAGHGY